MGWRGNSQSLRKVVQTKVFEYRVCLFIKTGALGRGGGESIEHEMNSTCEDHVGGGGTVVILSKATDAPVVIKA